MKKDIKISIIRTAKFAKGDNGMADHLHGKYIVNGDELFGVYQYSPYNGSHGKPVERWQRTGLVNVLKEDAMLALDEDFNPFGVYGEILMTQNKIRGLDGICREVVTFRLTERTKTKK